MRAAHVIFAVAALMGTACSKVGGATSKSPGTEAGARELLAEFAKQGADAAALSKQLRPTSADYAAVFDGAAAAKAEAGYAPMWDKGAMVIAGKPDQSEIKLFSATSEDLKAGSGGASHFPGGYKDVAPQLKGGLTLYAFKFVKPGEDLGMAFDGLVHVNGHWVIFPKPWRVLR